MTEFFSFIKSFFVKKKSDNDLWYEKWAEQFYKPHLEFNAFIQQVFDYYALHNDIEYLCDLIDGAGYSGHYYAEIIKLLLSEGSPLSEDDKVYFRLYHNV